MSDLWAWIAALALAGCTAKGADPPPAPPSVAVSMPLVKQIVDWDEFVGRFEAVDQVDVRPRVSGYVTRILFRDGDMVARGQPLFLIDPRPNEAALAQARADSKRAEAAAANAKVELERAQRLVGSGWVSRSVYDARLASTQSAEAALAAARASERSKALDLSFTRVTSPIAGRVSDRRVSVGNLVSADSDPPTLLTTVVSLNPIRFAFAGSEQSYLKYQRAAQAATRAGPRFAATPVEIRLQDETDYAWRGRMDFVDNALDTGSGTIRGRAVVENPRHMLTPGMYGRMRLLASGAYPALLIPDAAIMADQSNKIAYVVGPKDVVQPRTLVLGPVVDGLRVVRSGLAPGDRVIIEGMVRVRPGVTVSPRPGRIVPSAPTAPQQQVLTPPADAATDIAELSR
jgi:RND family efflux transporter MFP subunit